MTSEAIRHCVALRFGTGSAHGEQAMIEAGSSSKRGAGRLRAEFLALFVLAPLVMAILVPPRQMFSVLFGMTAVGLVLLHRTAAFRWRDLFAGRDRIDWAWIWLIGLLVMLFGAALLWLVRPEALFALVRRQPELMIMILLLYPLLSALPQELLFRALYFRRYQSILPRQRWAALLLNAAIFSLAHLMYWSWVVLFMTFVGGLAFAWAYEMRRSFPMAFLLHAVAGDVLFLVGLGVFFYSGNVVRPF
ncbi:CPBP family intramembrane glutamic endopeptidase [Tropicimonas sediminicola]|uniref:CAAX protease self-immunity n=1 Tax=Tropicimonas sediminicola TaxID=1031541 RepID=A0A239LW01_9RHOB|nr:type II CAAX endopeptidase family protein [Tropicimonas sediminicola]SNT34706.1 CAAX protease self-immunity [Tropicimonas sediminicola]